MTSTPVMIYSPSMVKKFRRCKRQYFYSVVEKLEPRLPDIKLKRGNWMHKLMDVKYRGDDWEKEHKRLIKEFNKLFVEEREMYGDLPDQVYRMMKGYEHRWRKEEAEWEILHVEETFEVKFTGGDILNFKPDLVVKDHGVPGEPIWIVDHKTTKSIPSADWRIEDLQSTVYYWAMKEVGYDVKGFIYNYIRTKDPTVPSINKDGSISRRRIDTDFYTLADFLTKYYEVDSLKKLPLNWKKQLATLKIDDRFRKRSRFIPPGDSLERTITEFSYTAQEIEVWHEIATNNPQDDPWVRTMEPSCEWGCDFHDLCMVEFMGGDGRFMRRAKYRPSEYIGDRGLGYN